MRHSGLIIELFVPTHEEGVEELAPRRASLMFNGTLPYALCHDNGHVTLFALDPSLLRAGVRVVGGTALEEALTILGAYDVDT